MAKLVCLLAGALLATGLSACGAGGGECAGSCAAVLRIDGHWYDGSRYVRRCPEADRRRVSAVLPACDDTGSADDGETDTAVTAAELAGVPPSVAVYRGDLIYLRRGATPPPEVRRALRIVPCRHAGVVSLTGVVEQSLREDGSDADGDLRQRTWLELHITAGPVAYRGTRLALHSGPWTTTDLTRQTVRELEGYARTVTVRVRCAGDRFRLTKLELVQS